MKYNGIFNPNVTSNLDISNAKFATLGAGLTAPVKPVMILLGHKFIQSSIFVEAASTSNSETTATSGELMSPAAIVKGSSRSFKVSLSASFCIIKSRLDISIGKPNVL